VRLVALIVITLFLYSGCMGAVGLKSNLENRKGELLYLHDSNKNNSGSTGNIKIKFLTVDDILPPAIITNKISGSTLPLIIFNQWEENFECTLGQSQITNDYKKFFTESFLQELNRQGYEKDDYVGSREIRRLLRLPFNCRVITQLRPCRSSPNYHICGCRAYEKWGENSSKRVLRGIYYLHIKEKTQLSYL
jgi:hypothetical protein